MITEGGILLLVYQHSRCLDPELDEWNSSCIRIVMDPTDAAKMTFVHNMHVYLYMRAD